MYLAYHIVARFIWFSELYFVELRNLIPDILLDPFKHITEWLPTW